MKINVTQINVIHENESNTLTLGNTGRDIVKRIINEGDHKIEEQDLNVEPYVPEKEIGLECDDPDLKRIFNDILILFRDPSKVAKNLEPLEQAISAKMSEKGIVYTDADFPEYLIAGPGFFIAGPPPSGYQLRKQGRLLNDVLLQREQKHGINTNGVPVFVGYVNPKEAIDLIKEGNLFVEDVQAGNTLFHSKNAHRLAFEVIRNAAESGDLDLRRGDGTTISHKELIKLMVTTNTTLSQSNDNAWNNLIDSTGDQGVLARKKMGEDQKYNYPKFFELLSSPTNFTSSSRSPYNLNAFLTCFGKEFNLPNLQHSLLNSHWKESAQVVERMDVRLNEWSKKAQSQRDQELKEEFKKLNHDFSDHYTHCMKILAVGDGINIGELSHTPLNIEPNKAAEANKYGEFSIQYPSVKRKFTEPNPVGTYSSTPQYLEEKKAKEGVKKENKLDSESKGWRRILDYFPRMGTKVQPDDKAR